jgi:acetyl-CoA acetyltransferase
MARRALFEGLVFDENDQPVGVVYIGDEPSYVVDDAGFKRHIPAEQVDRQVLDSMRELIEGHEGIISEQTAKMLGQEDIFTRAMIENQLKNIDQQFDTLFETGIPEEGRAYMGMMGFRITVNVHGEVVDIEQPGMISPDEE